MLAAFASIEQIPADGCADARHLVGGDGNADAGFAKENPSIKPAQGNSAGHLLADKRIITGIRGVRSQIRHLKTFGIDPLNQPGLKRKPAMVGPDGHAEPLFDIRYLLLAMAFHDDI